MSKTEKEIEIEIKELNTELKNNKITKKDYLEKQIELMEYSLKHLELSRIKKTHINNALRICKITYKLMGGKNS